MELRENTLIAALRLLPARELSCDQGRRLDRWRWLVFWFRKKMSFAVQFEMFMKFFRLHGETFENSADRSVSGRRSDRFDGG